MVDQATWEKTKREGTCQWPAFSGITPVPGTRLGRVLPREDHNMSMESKNTHSPAGKAHWPLPSPGLSALAAEYCLMILF